jgi:uncharacterized membrane protein
MTAPARVALRSRRERVIQTLWFEALGLALVSPLFAQFVGGSSAESLLVLAVLSVAVAGWSALYNAAVDWVELRCADRVASDRPHRWRLVHAVGLEVTAALLTWPLIVALTPLGWLDALVADIGLTVAYTVYGYLFHLAFDRLRPVRAELPDPAADAS